MYRQHQDASAGAGPQHFLSASTPSSSFSQTQFPSPLFALDPSLHNSPQLLHPAARHAASDHQSPARRGSTDSHGSMQPPASVSPRLNRATPTRSLPSGYTPADRSLPSKDVTASDIADAYVAFVLYCNPHFPLSTDTSTLRNTFQSPPKSDNKEFETYRLFELIKQFDAKEIKTWGQLALDLGVEAPDLSKGQSSQKVQQYTVRLKRWMRAMHIDAFFEYLLGKQHAYTTEIPHPSDPYPTGGRDGVLAEEDLAIRALDPSFRPKRGRRRNSEAELDDDADAGATTKITGMQHHGPASAYPISAVPGSAHPDSYQDPWATASAVTPQSFAVWPNRSTGPQSAVASTAPSHLRWQLHGSSNNPATPHPMTAQPTSMTAHIDAAFDNEPKSAVTPARKRRKHGPAVSSAWPSANAPGAKPRGRPPASRNVQDGPFSTFPADPANERSMVAKSGTPDPLPSIEHRPPPQMPPPLISRHSEPSGRPGRLSLQVPQHTGGPVRLATPPRVLVNGERNDSESRSDTRTPIVDPRSEMTVNSSQRVRTTYTAEREVPGFAFEVLKRVLTTDLLRADLAGRRQRLSGDEAKRLADAVLARLGVPRQDTDEPRDDIARLTAASWLGLGEKLNVPLGPATSQSKRIAVTRFRPDADGYEEIVSAYDEAPGNVREVFDLSWNVSLSNCNGSFELKGLSLNPSLLKEIDEHDGAIEKALATAKQVGNAPQNFLPHPTMRDVGDQRANGGQRLDDGINWRAKYMALEFGSKMAKGELDRFRDRTIEKILDALIE